MTCEKKNLEIIFWEACFKSHRLARDERRGDWLHPRPSSSSAKSRRLLDHPLLDLCLDDGGRHLLDGHRGGGGGGRRVGRFRLGGGGGRGGGGGGVSAQQRGRGREDGGGGGGGGWGAGGGGGRRYDTWKKVENTVYNSFVLPQ